MILNETQARDTILAPRSKQQIESVKLQESQLRVITQEMSENELSGEPYWNNLIERLNDRSDKKFSKIKSYFRYPLPVVQLTDSILNDYYKVFDGKNRAFNVNADRNVERLNQWIDETEPDKWIEEQAKEVLKGKPISFIVVDVDGNGNPYAILVDSERLVDVGFKGKKGELEYISFVHSQSPIEEKEGEVRTRYAVYDEQNYYVFYKDSDSDTLVQESLVSHNVGYCPARTFISNCSNEKNLLKRTTIFSKGLSKLEDWVIFDVFRNFVDHYAPFPITESSAQECGNPMCTDGAVPEEYPDLLHPGEIKTRYSACRVCEGNKFTPLPGTNIQIPLQEDRSKNDGSGIFKMIMPDVDKLEYVPKKLKDLEVEIRYKTVGVNQLLDNQSVNEMQVKGSFASMETILVDAKKQLDEVYRFYVKTVGRLFYKDISIMVEANFGTEFYLLSEEDLQLRYEKAKEIGLPAEEQLSIYKELVETKYKGNGIKLRRILMLLDLDPFPMYSLLECRDLLKENVIDLFDLNMKVNFLKFISKFEAQNTDITSFGIDLPYWERIDKINEELLEFNKASLKAKEERKPKDVPAQTGEGDEVREGNEE